MNFDYKIHGMGVRHHFKLQKEIPKNTDWHKKDDIENTDLHCHVSSLFTRSNSLRWTVKIYYWGSLLLSLTMDFPVSGEWQANVEISRDGLRVLLRRCLNTLRRDDP